MKYKTLAELKAAIDAGTHSGDPICLDNDSTTIYSDDDGDYEEIFEGGTPGELLIQALDLLGIPWENA